MGIYADGNEGMGIYAGGGYRGRSREGTVMGMRPWGYVQGEAMEVEAVMGLSWE